MFSPCRAFWLLCESYLKFNHYVNFISIIALIDDKMFYKSIINELVRKINIETPTYYTIKLNTLDHTFDSTIF